MSKALFIKTPEDFSFRSTIYSHGWCELAPFEIDEENWILRYVFHGSSYRNPVAATISEADGRINIELDDLKMDEAKIIAGVRHLLRLDDDLCGFYNVIGKESRLAWVREKHAGRLLRSQTVFEDLVKTICTTNCSWGLTKNMVTNLVEKLGKPTTSGKKSFPTAVAMADVNADFYRDEIRAGYRSPYFVELAQSVASGRLDPEAWLASDLATADLKKEMKKVKGVGDYAAENLLKLIGRYDGLCLDSWLRSQFYKKHNGEKACPDKKIERHYKKFGPWRGLAIWCDMTEKWIA
jgi:3-methyladenine DNA glycosylase/8-oxoguanine DNA glycosylase